jgi:AraC family transcriptional regulator of adaptative response/methylated-DNA-[protein]-cysteine methyltransferase
VEEDPTRRWRDRDLRDRGLEPARVRRWFKAHHGMTFHAWSRARRLGEALGRISAGEGVARAAFDAGYDSLSGFGEAFRKVAGATPSEAADATVVRVARLPTPLGPMVAGATDGAVVLLEFVDRRGLPRQVELLSRRTGWVFLPGRTPLLDHLRAGLDRWFAGAAPLPDLPVETPGTAFQRRVWEVLRAIPPGETRSYGAVAEAVGRPGAARAVARAAGANRVALLVPCHRVVGGDGDLTGYAGGIWRKRRLLEREARAAH